MCFLVIASFVPSFLFCDVLKSRCQARTVIGKTKANFLTHNFGSRLTLNPYLQLLAHSTCTDRWSVNGQRSHHDEVTMHRVESVERRAINQRDATERASELLIYADVLAEQRFAFRAAGSEGSTNAEPGTFLPGRRFNIINDD